MRCLRLALVPMMLLAGVLLSGCGCERKPRFVPANDSASTEADTTAARLREIVDLWESGGGYDDAAAQSAAIVDEDLSHRSPELWRARAQQFLDSLSIGAEIAGTRCAVAINFYSRSDPTAGSWPYLFWCDGQAIAHQRIEGGGMQLASLVARGFDGKVPRGVAALFTRRGGGGQQPILMVWAERGKKWQLAQTLGADSLGGAGSGEFDSKADAITLKTHTYLTAPYFEECPSCPHFYRDHTFAWGSGGFYRVSVESVPSTYATFVEFIQDMMANDWNRAALRVTHRSLLDAARRYSWDRPQGSWRVAPVSEQTGDELVMYRGNEEAYRVHFEPWNRDWLISGFEPVPRAID